jgi:hypothetical protein
VAGPDVAFIFDDLNGDGRYEVVATQFFDAQQISLFYCDEALWCVPPTKLTRSLPLTVGPLALKPRSLCLLTN